VSGKPFGHVSLTLWMDFSNPAFAMARHPLNRIYPILKQVSETLQLAVLWQIP
jgi:hypothetical protein